ncbi:hypothetical protein BN946_scf185028.g22 [Trametes cinnabarina]|uniref:Xylanolytic transcriptional activator regulatory domain-containing protein n=1 Tax=Pycnoporus cinnabarinus TaxID=5643 RepID=A0A060SRI9_PYCCI|nr:hypothetical protein BN946_scf185028.g22 [Trametes cinnabarina]
MFLKLGDPYRAKWTYARSANTTTVSEPFQPGNHPLSGPIQQLVENLPLRHVAETLIDGYFAERNWQFGIPEQWFRRCCEQMWRHLRLRCPGPSCHLSGGCARCTEELNPHWLSLMFAVLALAPQRIVGSSAKTYFLKAMEARRLVEDILLASRAYSQPSAVQGVVLSCIGAALLARYLADRGRMSDAWKLTGTALRNAQAVGLHRDPGWQKWENMDKQERELRVLGWWFLVIADRLYSFTLGRPMMSTEGSFDVKMVPDDVHGDGSPNPVAIFHQHFIGLIEIMGEMIDKCMGVQMPAYATVLEIDRKFKFWLCRLHPSLDWREQHTISNPITFEERTRAYQRHMCAGYYLCATMNLHRPYLMHAPPILPPPKPLSATMTVIMNPSRERCIELAMELVRVMCDAQEEAAGWQPDPQQPAMMYHYAYFVFDGAIALVGAFSQEPPHPKARECLTLIDRAMRMLHWCVEATRNAGGRDGEGETANRAITVLNALRKAGRWDERFRKDETRPDGDGSPGYQDSRQERSEEAVQDGMFSYGQPGGLNLAEVVRFTTGSLSVPENFNIPYLNTPASGFSFPFSNPMQTQSSATMPIPFGDGRDFTASVPVGMSGVDASGSGSGGAAGASRGTASMQTMLNNLEVVQRTSAAGRSRPQIWEMRQWLCLCVICIDSTSEFLTAYYRKLTGPLVIKIIEAEMSMGDSDSKFPGQRSPAIPPSPTRENPGQVYPQSDPQPAAPESIPGTGGEGNLRTDELLGNPYVLEDAFSKLDSALSEVISRIQTEERSVGNASNGDTLLQKFTRWRDELTEIRRGRKSVGSAGRGGDALAQQQEGGLFTD